MIASHRAWAFVGIALAAGGCGGAASNAPGDGGVKNTSGDATTEDAGSAGDAGADSGTKSSGGCVDGGVTFAFGTEAGAPVCPGSSGTSCKADADWLTLTGPDGATVAMFNPTCVDCSSCTGGCPPGPCLQPVPSLVGQWSWDGTVFTSSTCGGGGEACGAASCVGAGHYTAKMCAFAPLADAGPGSSACDVPAPAVHCVSVPFDWPLPSGSSVVGSF